MRYAGSACRQAFEELEKEAGNTREEIRLAMRLSPATLLYICRLITWRLFI